MNSRSDNQVITIYNKINNGARNNRRKKRFK